MKVVKRDQNLYILRFDPGEEVIGEVKKFCEERQIQAGYFTGLGAASEITLAFYQLAAKTYQDKVFDQELEISSLHGNVSRRQNETVVHTHGSFSDENFETFGGHVKKLVVSATCELILARIPGRVDRALDEKTGLNLMQ